MQSRHYDVIIAGQSLSLRIAAALLAKGGCRVLHFTDEGTPNLGWFTGSLHLEHLVELLGARPQFAPPVPFQVVSERERLEINGSYPLEEELRREFPEAHHGIDARLKELKEIGEILESVLLEGSTLPGSSLSARCRFLGRQIRAGLGIRRLGQPLASLWQGLAPATREFLARMFSGLAARPASTLTVGDGALVWSLANRPRALEPEELLNLLDQRFEQFRGATLPLKRLGALQAGSRKVEAMTLGEGGQVKADWWLGDSALTSVLPERWRQKISSPQTEIRQLHSTAIDGPLSPMLARRIILGDGSPLRLTLGRAQDAYRLAVELVEGVALGSEEIERRIARLVPFRPFDLSSATGSEDLGKPAHPAGQPTPCYLKAPAVRGNLDLHHGPQALPALGPAGEVMLGVLAAGRILDRTKK